MLKVSCPPSHYRSIPPLKFTPNSFSHLYIVVVISGGVNGKLHIHLTNLLHIHLTKEDQKLLHSFICNPICLHPYVPQGMTGLKFTIEATV